MFNYLTMSNLYEGQLPFTKAEFNHYSKVIDDLIKDPVTNSLSPDDSKRVIELVDYCTNSGVDLLNAQLGLLLGVSALFLAPLSLTASILSVPFSFISAYVLKRLTNNQLSDYQRVADSLNNFLN